MVIPKLIFGLILLLSFGVHSQVTEVKSSIYFDSDKYELKPSEENKLNQLWEKLADVSILSVRITGHTDNSADSLYNINLSKNRCQTVEQFFSSKDIEPESIVVNYFGENKPKATNGNEEGKQENRRVDIQVVYKIENRTVIEDIVVERAPAIPVKDKCKGDTTIVFENGTEVVFNKCEYLEIADCLEMTSIRNTDEIINSGLSMTTVNDVPLVTCGMFNVCLKPDCKVQRDKFQYPLKVRFPFPTEKEMECIPCLTRMPRVFDANSDGAWEPVPGNEEKIEIVNLNGRLFYEMIIMEPNCDGMKNCDCPKCPPEKWYRRKACPYVRLKVPLKYKLISAQIFVDCPATTIDFAPKKRIIFTRKRFAKTKTPCAFGDHRIRVTAIDREGNEAKIDVSPLAPIRHRILFSKCKYEEERDSQRVLGIFRARKRGLYRKYKIRKRDFEAAAEPNESSINE